MYYASFSSEVYNYTNQNEGHSTEMPSLTASLLTNTLKYRRIALDAVREESSTHLLPKFLPRKMDTYGIPISKRATGYVLGTSLFCFCFINYC